MKALAMDDVALFDWQQWSRVGLRLIGATLLGGVIGIQREHTGKPAGLRTHMLVALAACLFVVAMSESGMTSEDASRVIQGVAAGVGFIAGGAILKLRQEQEVHGLTTAAGLWMTAAVGIASGMGLFIAALLSVILTWITLAVVAWVEPALHGKGNKKIV
jgi:putative Mg2+ transporter-C (MgtC) family protein